MNAAIRLCLVALPIALASCASQQAALADADSAELARSAEQRIKALERRARRGEVDAMLELAARHYEGLGVTEDVGEAAHWYRAAADRGSAAGQFSIGVMYENGEGVMQSSAEAARWYERAAEQGELRALTNLGLLLVRETGELRDAVRAREVLGQAAEQDHPGAQLALGRLLIEGVGGAVDTETGIGWVRRAAEAGDAAAMRVMSTATARGLGVPADVEASLHWLVGAARAGDARAALEFGIMALEDGDSDPAVGASYVRQAAEAGIPEAMHNMGLLHLRGRGVPEDGAVAAEWFRRAAALGHEPSARAADRLGQRR